MTSVKTPGHRDGCPKRMRFGPCGGVQPPHDCEVPAVECPFTRDAAPVAWPGPRRPSAAPPPVPTVLADLRPDPTLEWEVATASELLMSVGAGVLIGDHVDDLTPHTPATVAEAITGHGVPVVSTLTCRNRSAEDLADQLQRLAAAGVCAVHCVTGDHPAARLGLGDEPFFAMDSFELIDLARRSGVGVSAAESPAAPPREWRPIRLASKEDAGAELAILNHCGDPATVIEFADACQAAGLTIPLVAPVPVITDRRSADALTRFPGLQLPPGLLDRILGARDPVAEGCEIAIRLADQLLTSGRFAGVNLSGSATAAGVVARAEVMASVAGGIAT